jgi:TRAP-type C4-dicarboxylate transport system permease small subunit
MEGEGRHKATLSRAMEKVSGIMCIVSGITLTCVMVLIGVDVIGRALGHPLIASYEVIQLAGALIVGLSMPFAALSENHVKMEFLVDRLHGHGRDILNSVTRVVGVIMFAVLGAYLFKIGAEFHTAGEATPTLFIPIYPGAYIIGFACFVQCIIFIDSITKIWKGEEGAHE